MFRTWEHRRHPLLYWCWHDQLVESDSSPYPLRRPLVRQKCQSTSMYAEHQLNVVHLGHAPIRRLCSPVMPHQSLFAMPCTSGLKSCCPFLDLEHTPQNDNDADPRVSASILTMPRRCPTSLPKPTSEDASS